MDNVIEFTDKFLSSNAPVPRSMPHTKTLKRSQHSVLKGLELSFNKEREQSIIPPWESYGAENSRCRPKLNQPEPTPPQSPPIEECKAAKSDDIRHCEPILNLEVTPAPSSRPRRVKISTRSNRKDIELDSNSSDEENGNDVQRSPPTPLATLPMRHSSINTRFRRHQSLPARTIREDPSPRRTNKSHAPSTKHELESIVDAMVRKHLTEQTVPAPEARTPELPPPKRRKLSTAERKLRDPPVSKDVPMRLRKPDAQLLYIAAMISPYERHRRAPYAFRYNGKLYAEYKHLRVAVGNDGRPVLSAEELSRL